MFGNKNSAVPYVRIGGVDRQSVLTSNANGNTPVKEIGVDANGNLVFSVDWETFKSVLDLKYSQFKSNDEDQNDTWKTEKSVSMIASGTLEDGTTKETGVIVSQEYSAMVSASMKDDASSVSQIAVRNKDVTLHSTDGTSTTQLFVTPTGAKVNDKSVAVTDDIPTALSQLSEDATHKVVTDTEKQTWNAKSDFDGDYNSLINKPTIPTNADFTLADLKEKSYNSLTDKPTIPTKTSQLTNDSNYTTISQLNGKVNYSDIVQSNGTNTDKVMSQNAVTTALNGKLSTSGGTLTGDLKLTIGENIIDSNNKALIKTNANGVIFGDPTSLISIKGSQVRPFYTSGTDNTTKSLALYSDIPDYFTTAGTTGGNTSGSLTLTNGHLYRVWVIMGSAQLACMVKMPTTSVEQYWFMGMNIYNHYVRLHISTDNKVTFQYANVGQNNWQDNKSVYIYYEDITSKS